MNKQKQNILTLRRQLILKLAKQIQPFKPEIAWLNGWYVTYAKTPLQTANEISQMRNNKLNIVFYKIMNENLGMTCYQFHGTLFSVKFPMCLYASNNLPYNICRQNYNKWLDDNAPEISIVNKTDSIN